MAVYAIAALTVAAMAIWFWRVFRSLYFQRHAVEMLHERIASHFSDMSDALMAMGQAFEVLIPSMVSMGDAMHDITNQMIAELSPKQRAIFEELEGIGVLPVDAIREACARWPD